MTPNRRTSARRIPRVRRFLWRWVLPVWLAGVSVSASPACGQPPQPGVELREGAAVRQTGRRNVRIEARWIVASPSIVLTDCHGVVITGCDLNSIQLNGCTDVVIENNTVHDSDRVGVGLDECREVVVRGNRFSRVSSGVYAHRSSGVRVLSNRCEDVRGPMPRGQMVQFDKVTGSGNEVAFNLALNRFGQSRPEDVVSVYQSRGTPDAPIDVHHNLILGDPTRGSSGKSDSGSGIMLGDGGGAFQVARQNLLLSPGQVGIGVAGGEHIAVTGNLVRGAASDVSNVGIYAWNQSGKPGGNITVTDNAVHWTNADGVANDLWFGEGFGRVREAGNTPRATDLLALRSLWRRWLAAFVAAK